MIHEQPEDGNPMRFTNENLLLTNVGTCLYEMAVSSSSVIFNSIENLVFLDCANIVGDTTVTTNGSAALDPSSPELATLTITSTRQFVYEAPATP